MALPDILTAIIKESDAQIAALEQQHASATSEAKAKAAIALSASKADTEVKKKRDMDQLRKKAEQEAQTMIRNAVLERKRALLDRTFDAVLAALSQEADATVEPLLKACLAQVKSGEIRPAKPHAALIAKLAQGLPVTVGSAIDARGGFLCVSKTREQDFRFETLVSEFLRPRTELAVAQDLFSSDRA